MHTSYFPIVEMNDGYDIGLFLSVFLLKSLMSKKLKIVTANEKNLLFSMGGPVT